MVQPSSTSIGGDTDDKTHQFAKFMESIKSQSIQLE